MKSKSKDVVHRKSIVMTLRFAALTNNDGDLDAYFPQGSPLPGWEKDKILENKLEKN